MSQTLSLSIVVSVFNEEAVLPHFLQKLDEVLSGLNTGSEVVVVNDGSTDGSLEKIRLFRETTKMNIRVIEFSRNFGHEAAMIAGIDHALGKAIICLDSDLQHPPDQIPNMYNAFLQGEEIITMVRERRSDNGALKNWFSRKFYQFINRLSEFHLDENASDFFLISATVADVLRSDFRERNRFLRGFIQIVGFRKKSIPYIAPKRLAGETKYSFFKLLKLSANAIIAFSKLPLYLGIYIGILFAFFSIVLGFYTLAQYIFGNTPPSGYTTIVLFLSLSFSVLFILVGIIGTYVGYIFDENKARPLYIIRNIQ